MKNLDTLAVLDFQFEEKPELMCSSIVRDTLVQSQSYQVLPLWHTQQQTRLLSPHDWEALFRQLSPAQMMIQGVLELNGTRVTLHMVAIKNASPPEIVFVDSKDLPLEQMTTLCRTMAQRFIGKAPVLMEKSPALAATLSFILPGSGHFYLGEPLSVLMGAGFLSAYMSAAYLGLSGTTQKYVSREQWGGVLILISLTDILTAYFVAQSRSDSQ